MTDPTEDRKPLICSFCRSALRSSLSALVDQLDSNNRTAPSFNWPMAN